MIDFENQTDLEINLDDIKEIIKYITDKEFELIVVNNEMIQSLNKEYRNIDKPTDVLSFPLDVSCPGMPIGSIIISADYVKNGADKFGHTELDEFKLLLIHGLLHLIGYDHEQDNGEMREKEKEIIEKFNLPKSLIVRVED
jgi:probable rRNA maturation factor